MVPRPCPFVLLVRPALKMPMSMQHWWNDTDRRKSQVIRKEPAQVPLFHNTGFCRQRPVTNRLRHGKLRRQKLKVLYYPMFPDFQKRNAFWNVPRLHSYVLLVTATYR